MKGRILLIDDHLDEVRFVQEHLTNVGYRVMTACNGPDALLACKNHFDVILLDMRMPDMNGIEVCKVLRAEQHNKTPIIFLTADTREESEIAGLRAGGNEYITKPFSVRALETRIAKLIDDRAHEAALSLKLQKWREKAAVDELTGLRRREYIGHLPANMQSHGVLMLDVDHFKSVNDEHGHAAGDKVLMQVAAVIRQFDPNAIRMGGEEFLVTVDDGNAAEQLAESIRSAIEAKVRRPCNAALTVSIGAVNVDEAASTKHTIACADKLLYESKSSGRNCVTAGDISAIQLGRRFRDQS